MTKKELKWFSFTLKYQNTTFENFVLNVLKNVIIWTNDENGVIFKIFLRIFFEIQIKVIILCAGLLWNKTDGGQRSFGFFSYYNSSWKKLQMLIALTTATIHVIFIGGEV